MVDKIQVGEGTYITWDDKATGSFQKALDAASDNVNSYEGIARGSDGSFDRRGDVIQRHTDRNNNEGNYWGDNWWYTQMTDAPGNMDMATWQSMQDMYACMRAYERTSIVRSVVDMMSDFTSMGIRIVHRDKKIENFMKNWAKTVDFNTVSERIANMLYRVGNCPIRFRFGKIPIYFENEWRKGYANLDDESDDVKLQKQTRDYKSIPLSYTILDPLSLDVVGGSLQAFLGKPLYALRISNIYKNVLIRIEREAVSNNQAKELLKFMPDKLKQAILGRRPMIPIEPEKISVLFYKKDDWRIWASPMLVSILEPLDLLDSMHKADRAALSGAMSQVRVWKLGDIENKILPTRATLNRLRDELSKVGNGGTMDLVWGPDIEVWESQSTSFRFLGAEKYHQVMTEIYAGLGVPPSLTGSSKGNDSGFTNNSISMKIMIERLEYVRKILTKFWENEFKKIQQSMGWRFPAKITWDFQALSDTTEKALYLDMCDRNIIPHETMLELCRRDPELEAMRIKRESVKQDSGKLPPKASPFHNANQDGEMQKIALQSGHVAPSEVGLDLQDKKPGEVTPKQNEMKQQLKIQQMNNDHKLDVTKDNNRTAVKVAKYAPGISGQGRPKNSNDKKKRKPKTVKPRTTGFNLFNWANNTQNTIAEALNPKFLEKYDKKTMRSLTKIEMSEVEEIKFNVLSNIEPYTQVTAEIVYNILDQNPTKSEDIEEAKLTIAQDFEKQYDREPTLEEMRQIQSSAYSLVKGGVCVED